jgi:hypothetical protein
MSTETDEARPKPPYPQPAKNMTGDRCTDETDGPRDADGAPRRPTSGDVGRAIDQAEPSEALKRGVAKDLDAHLPAGMIPGQSAQEPLVKSQREAEEDESPGAL